MPIGVPRIIYCWGEELPAQWTDIYNFIFRRRMVFLMQYLDDELCNQICGLLINIHMEDRTKELEEKSMEKSGIFKSSPKSSFSSKQGGPESKMGTSASLRGKTEFGNKEKISAFKNEKSIDDLLISEDDLAIDENQMLEQYALQKITLDWLNWNAQFFDYSNEPYLFYLAELLSKDFTKDAGNLFYNTEQNQTPYGSFSYGPAQDRISLMKMFRNMKNSREATIPNSANSGHFDVYSPFRSLANISAQDYSLKNLNHREVENMLNNKLKNISANLNGTFGSGYVPATKDERNFNYYQMLNAIQKNLAHKQFSNKVHNQQNNWESSEKALGQRQLKRHYRQEIQGAYPFPGAQGQQVKPSYLDFNAYSNFGDLAFTREGSGSAENEYSRKQVERILQQEEAKKVFVMINSFGGSVGNGITVHDALQFIKAGSLTLGLGVAASAASLALAGGTIGERYVTEGCHVMIHQPEGGLNGQASDIWIDSMEVLKIRLDVAEIYSLSTYRPRHKVLRDLDRDFYLTASETVAYGLADEIATNEVMTEIIQMTNQVWDYHDSQQQRLLEARSGAIGGPNAQSQQDR